METALAKTDIQNGTSMPDKPLHQKTPEEIKHWLRSARTPLDMIDEREGRGGRIYYYLRHQYVTKTLNDITSFDWDFEILRERLDEDQITVLGKLTLRVGDVLITKSQYGSSDVKRTREGKALSMGDDFKSAASDSLKKCASLLGLGLDLTIPMTESTRKHLHALGTKVFEEAWEKSRHRAVRIITNGKHTSSNELTDIEARLLIAVMEGDLKTEPAKSLAQKLKP